MKMKVNYNDIKNEIIAAIAGVNNILILDFPGCTHIKYYEISSGTVHTVRLYICPNKDDNYFIYNGRRVFISQIIFYNIAR